MNVSLPPSDAGLSRRAVLQTGAAASALAVTRLPSVTWAQDVVSAGLPRTVALTVNGARHEVLVDPRTTILDVLRERIGLTGTKKGCDHGQCGACTILLDGQRINACLTLAVMHEDDAIVTVEGLADGDALSPLQAAFIEEDAFQCGYCTPGQLCSATAMLSEIAAGWPSHASVDVAAASFKLTAEEVRERMSGNLCRCAAYNGISAAILRAGGEA